MSLYAAGTVAAMGVALVALKGYRETRSPTLLRLTAAFALIATSFMADAVANLALFGLIPIITIVVSMLLLMSRVLELAGYFFLAFSHVVNVRSLTKMRFMSAALFLPAFNPAAALQSLSFFFVLFGAVETIMAYARTRKSETLLIATGLLVICFSMLVVWTSYLYPLAANLLAYALLAKISGFAILLLPVARFASRKRVVGPW